MEKTGPSVTRFTMKELEFYGHDFKVRFGAAHIDEDVDGDIRGGGATGGRTTFLEIA